MRSLHKIAILLIIILNVVVSFPQAYSQPVSVVSFYRNMKALETASDVNTANKAQQIMSSCFMASDQSGIDLDMDGLGSMSSNLYTMKLYSMIFSDKSLKLSYQLGDTELIEQPDQTASLQKKGARHKVTYVDKTYVQNGRTITYKDLVFTYVDNGLIVAMQNSLDNNVRPKPIQDSPSRKTENIEQLRAQAGYYYTRKNYTLAYNCYERIVQSYPNDGDANYRIALLTFWRKGCSERFTKKSARNKAIDYINKAITYGNAEIAEKATNVKNNWTNNNIYF